MNYSNVKPEREETNCKFLHRSTPSVERVVFLYLVSSINNQTRCPIFYWFDITIFSQDQHQEIKEKPFTGLT
jgi:hypothetical protein